MAEGSTTLLSRIIFTTSLRNTFLMGRMQSSTLRSGSSSADFLTLPVLQGDLHHPQVNLTTR